MNEFLVVVAILAMGVALGVLFWCLQDWRYAVFFLFLWLPLEGLVRKSSGEFQILVFFVKDLLIAVVYLQLLYRGRFH